MISIVAGYYNRKKLFYETLKSISRSTYKDIEFIAVDDASSQEQRIEEFQTEFPFLKVIRIEPQHKWYINPCIPFNIGLREAKGDVIVLENPECYHVHDILTYVKDNIDDTKYITFSAYGIDSSTTTNLSTLNQNNNVINIFNSFPQRVYIGGDYMGWYNHSKYRPVFYHFCSAITRKNMEILNGFDERYAHGFGYDDNEILVRIYRMGLKISIEDSLSVLHQYHTSSHWNGLNAARLVEVNRSLFTNVTIRESRITVNEDKLWNGI